MTPDPLSLPLTLELVTLEVSLTDNLLGKREENPRPEYATWLQVITKNPESLIAGVISPEQLRLLARAAWTRAEELEKMEENASGR